MTSPQPTRPLPPLPPLPYRHTPLIHSPALSRAANCAIYLKLETLQPSSSFKSRGIGHLIHSVVCASLRQSSSGTPPASLHFFSSSGGNAGLAAVHASAALGYPCSVVVPESTEASVVVKLRGAGAAEVIVKGESWAFADEYLRGVVMEEKRREGVQAVYVPPFDDARVWEGHESLVREVREEWGGVSGGEGKPDAVVCSVGGGGLLVGMVQGVEKVAWASAAGRGPGETKVLAVETKGAESLAYALEKGEVATLPGGITSVAKSLGAVRVAPRALEVAQRGNVRSVVISDAEACMGMWRFADDERILVEPACGAAVAMAYLPDKLREVVGEGVGPESKVVIVVCGGSRIDLDTMNEYRERFGPEIEKMGLAASGKGKVNAKDAVNGVKEIPSQLTTV